MPCIPFRTPDGEGGFVCTRGDRKAPCSVPGCHRQHERLCDWKLGPGAKRLTCDAKLCAEHATRIAPERDLCPAHAKLHAVATGNVGVVAATAVALLGGQAVRLAQEAEARKVAIEQRRQLAVATGISTDEFERILGECGAEAERSVYEIDLVALLDRRLSEHR